MFEDVDGIRGLLGGLAVHRMQHNGLPYHNLQHIQDMNKAFAAAYGTEALTLEIELAILWHDFVYVPGAPTGYNEELSACALRSAFTQANGLDTDAYQKWAESLDVDAVCEIIRATNVFNHTSASYEPSSTAIARVMDCDLCSLAADYPDFVATQDRILVENVGLLTFHTAAALAEFRCKQAQFLSLFVADLRPYVYRTPEARALWEEKARSNITSFIDAYGA